VAVKEAKRNWWEDPGRERRGRSTLEKWSCACGQNARIGTRAHFAVCMLCGEPFLPQREMTRMEFAQELVKLFSKRMACGAASTRRTCCD